MCKNKKNKKIKKPKSEVVRPKDDFTFKIYRNRLLRARFRFLKKKKETSTVEDDFTFNVVLHHDDLTLFYKKNFNGPIFTNSWSK